MWAMIEKLRMRLVSVMGPVLSIAEPRRTARRWRAAVRVAAHHTDVHILKALEKGKNGIARGRVVSQCKTPIQH